MDFRLFRFSASICAVIISLISPVSYAKCMSERISVWPPPEVAIPSEGALLLVEGYGDAQEKVSHLKDGDAYLVSDNEKIPLLVWRSYRGALRIVVVALTPAKPLTRGKRYSVQFPFSADHTDWMVAGADHDPPRWTSQVKVLDKSWTEFGCGPASEVWLDVPLSESPSAVLVTVAATKGAPENAMILPVRDGKVMLGHGMCSGAFEFSAEQEYQATVMGLDLARNPTQSPHQVVKFFGPTWQDGQRKPGEEPGGLRKQETPSVQSPIPEP